MENEKTYTEEQIIMFTMNILSNIEVAVGLYEKVGRPIENAINNLEVCLEMEKKRKAQTAAADENAEEPETEDAEEAENGEADAE